MKQSQAIDISESYLGRLPRTPHNPALHIIAEINRLRGNHHARTRRDLDHRCETEARTVRNTVVNTVPSIPDATLITAPASLTSIAEGAGAVAVAVAVSVTIGTKDAIEDTAGSPGAVAWSARAYRRHVKICCEQS